MRLLHRIAYYKEKLPDFSRFSGLFCDIIEPCVIKATLCAVLKPWPKFVEGLLGSVLSRVAPSNPGLSSSKACLGVRRLTPLSPVLVSPQAPATPVARRGCGQVRAGVLKIIPLCLLLCEGCEARVLFSQLVVAASLDKPQP